MALADAEHRVHLSEVELELDGLGGLELMVMVPQLAEAEARALRL